MSSYGSPIRPIGLAASAIASSSGSALGNGCPDGGFDLKAVGDVGADEDPANAFGDGLARLSSSSATTTRAPSSANRRAMPSPVPAPTPVNLATLPANAAFIVSP